MGKNKIDLNKLLIKIPEDVIRYIQTFLSYYTLIDLFESKYKFSVQLNKLPSNVVSGFYVKLRKSKEYYALLDSKEAEKEMSTNVTTIYHEGTNTKRKLHFNQIMLRFKKENPSAAFRILKMFAIMCKPPKKYIMNYQQWYNLATKNMLN